MHRQNIGGYKIWCQRNIGGGKILAPAKHRRRQNIVVNKILSSKKHWRWQNIGIPQNLGVDKMLAHAWKHLLTVLARQSPQQLTSPRPCWCFPTSPWRCCTLHVQLPGVKLPHAALLLLADSLPHCTGLFVPARIAENVTNIGLDKILAPAKISLIFAKL